MRFASWNIAGGHLFRKSVEDALSYEEENLDYFISELEKIVADILVLQESHTPIDTTQLSQASIIAKKLGYKLAGNHPYQENSHIKKGNQLSLAVLSKHPVINSSFHRVPNPNLKITRENGDQWKTYDVGFLNCALDYHGTKINVSNGHMVPFHYFHRDFLEPTFQPIRDSIVQLFISLSQQPTIVGADFNFNNLKSLLPPIFEKGLYKEAFIGIETTPGKGQQDHLLASHQWVIKTSDVKKKSSTDHFMCVMDVELNL